MTTAILLIVLGTLARLAPHEPGGVAMGALALYAGARLPRRWALLVPLAAMLVSDVWIDWGSGRPVFGLVRVTIYATFAGVVLAGRFLRESSDPWRRGGLALGASLVFFLTTNLAVWASPQVASVGHPLYPPSAQGLALCYFEGLPFLKNSAIADLIGITVLFTLDFLGRRVIGWVNRRRVVAAPSAE